MLNPDRIHLVYRRYPKKDGGFERRLAGKFATLDNELSVHSDYYGLLGHLEEGPVTDRHERLIHQMKHSPYLDVVTRGDIASGKRPDLIPVRDLKEAPKKPDLPDPTHIVNEDHPMGMAKLPSVFLYHRVGMDKPHMLEFLQGRMHLDGKALDPDEVRTVIGNIHRGTATLRYHQNKVQRQIAKVEDFLASLHKQEGKPKLRMSMDALKDLVAQGHLPQEHFDAIRQELYHDDMVPSVGNKRAYNEFVQNKDRGGVHVMLDANDFKSINDELSHSHGDQAIKAMGQAIRNATDKAAPEGSVHRFGGDEFHVHLPSHDHATQFLRHLRNELEIVPPIGGTHKLSVSAGIAHTPEHADMALNDFAKKHKATAVAAAGGDPSARVGKIRAPHALYAHSLFPGKEGQMPTETDQVPLVPPAPPESPSAADAPKAPTAAATPA